MTNLNIRIAVSSDAKDLIEIYAPYVTTTAITFEYTVPTLEEFTSRIENTLERYPYLVALINDEIVGYAYASAFKSRAAYDWSVESTIYLKKDCRHIGIGHIIYEELEQYLIKQNVQNINACIAYTCENDEHLSNDSMYFHKKSGYSLVGTFHKCGYKFNHWYDMIWMEKMIGKHVDDIAPFIPFSELNMV